MPPSQQMTDLASKSTASIYHSLDETCQNIRVVKLLPSKQHNDALVCELQVIYLIGGPPFQSLSYAWGQDKADVRLKIGSGYLSITKNLENALRVVRRPEQAVLLWVDAICINQEDVKERNHQVQMMQQIYSTATQVNIWLGSPFPGAEESFSILEELADGRPLGLMLSIYSNKGAVIDNLTAVFKYPWWQRLWVIQEALLARRARVFCGSFSISFQTIMQAFEMLWNEYIQTGQQLRLLCGADAIDALVRQLELTVRRFRIARNLVFVNPPDKRQQFRDNNKIWPFLLRVCSWSNCSDSRDKVYGSLGLLPSSLLHADYRLDLKETYTKSTFHMINRMSNLALVSQAISNLSLKNGLPSWVPDWRYPSHSTAPFLVCYDLFEAGTAPLDVKLVDGHMLELSAAQVDEVIQVGSEYDNQGCSQATKLPSFVCSTMENWIGFLNVPFLVQRSFTEQFTSRAIAELKGSTTSIQKTANMMAMQQLQTTKAPMHGDVYKVQNNWSTMQAPQQMQSTRASLYRDMDYAAPPPAKRLRGAKSNGLSSDRVYDAFSHTYIDAEQTRLAPHSGEPNPSSTLVAKDSGDRYFTGDSSSEVFWRTLCMDVVDCQRGKKHRRCNKKDSPRVWEWMDWIFRYSQPGGIPQLHWHLNTHLQGKRMLKTKLGYVGLASRDVRVGDRVFVIAGETYPYVLRPRSSESGEDSFVIVCPSYIHGWMDASGARAGKGLHYETIYVG